MKQLLILISVILSSSLLLAQKKNILLNVCTIGDTIYKLPTQLYCVDINNKTTKNISECDKREFRYFPLKDDSSSFTIVRFDAVLIISDDQFVATKIWLLKTYPTDSLTNTSSQFESEYSLLTSFLNNHLNVSGEEIRENATGGSTVIGVKWTTDSLTYRIKRLILTQKKMKTYTINVEIF